MVNVRRTLGVVAALAAAGAAIGRRVLRAAGGEPAGGERPAAATGPDPTEAATEVLDGSASGAPPEQDVEWVPDELPVEPSGAGEPEEAAGEPGTAGLEEEAVVEDEPIASEPEPAEAWAPEGVLDAPAEATGELDLNEASFEQLRGLGLSVTQAKRILAARDEAGGFSTIDEIDAIPGLSMATLSELRERLRV